MIKGNNGYINDYTNSFLKKKCEIDGNLHFYCFGCSFSKFATIDQKLSDLQEKLKYV